MIDQDSRARRLDIALRRNRAQRVTPAYLRASAEIVGRPLTATADLADLESTDRLFTDYSRAFAQLAKGGVAIRSEWSLSRSAQIFTDLRAMSEKIKGDRVALFGRDYRDVGALLLYAEDVFAHAEALLDLSGGELRVFSTDRGSGLLVDKLERESQVELWLWGHAWMSAYHNRKELLD